MAGRSRGIRAVADPVSAVTETVPLVPPPLAVVAGAAKALASAVAPTERLRALCAHLRSALPADEVRLRAGARATDRHQSGHGGGSAPFTVPIPLRDDRQAVIEALGARRPPAELRPILETVAAMLATLLPVFEQVDEGDVSVVQRLHRLTVDSLPVGLYVVDREYRIVLWNRKRETGTQGLRREEVLGRPITEVFKRQPPGPLLTDFERVFETGEVSVSEQGVTVGGESRIYRTSRLPMRLEGTAISHVITIGEDITERRALQQAVHQTEKLAAVGQLAAGVMHEINNPLATIGACVAAISSRLGEGAPPVVQEYLDIIESEVERCTHIIDGLLDFSRAGAEKPGGEPVEINALLERTLFLLKHHQRFRRLEVTREFTDPLPPVVGNGERLIQGAMAILLNAADAAGGRGRIVVRTRAERGSVVVEFEDDGPGIPQEVLPKIFEPFFTTKGPGRGTGLGLAICYGIVADHGGHLDVRSEPGSTVFEMRLPAAAGEGA